jgi:hypothetical protein
MYVQAAGQARFDVIEKSQELLMSVPPVATADRNATGHIQSREQGSDSVPLIIVRLARRHAGRQGQDRLRPIQCLHLALFVNTENDRTIRWVQI